MGGGVVGVEMSQAYCSLGAQVTLIEGERRLLPREEEFACEQVTEALARAGRRHPHRPEGRPRAADGRRGRRHARRRRRGHAATSCSSPSGAARRSSGLGLETVGLEPRRLRRRSTSTRRVPGHDWLYVIGDLNGRAPFTHMAKYQARDRRRPRARQATARPSTAPTARSRRGSIFTDPQVAAVGHTTGPPRTPGLSPRVIDIADLGQRRRLVLRPQRARHQPLPRRRASAACSSARRSRARRSPTSSTRRRSRSSARCPSTRLRHAVPAFPTRSEIWLQPARAARHVSLSAPRARRRARAR